MLVEQLAVLGDDLVLLEPGEAMQAHVEDRLRLRFREPVAVRLEAEFRRQGLRAGGDGAGALQQLRSRRPAARRAPAARVRASAGDGAALMSAITSSMLASATARPSRMWARSRALARS